MANFNDETVLQVWEKAKVVPGADPNVWRKDYAGAWINFNQRKTEDPYGWEIDHQNPVANGGSDNLSNLQPLHWRNNRCKSDNYPQWTTCLTGGNGRNVEEERRWKVS